MNCREFDSIRDDLARGRVKAEDVRESAALHSKTCDACARRLADERSLAVGLESFAASEAHLEAPARVEAALIEAFRKQSSASYEPAMRIKPRLSIRLRWAAAAAVAAIMLIVFALSASRSEQTGPGELQASENKPTSTDKKEKGKPEPEVKRDKPEPPKKKRLVLLHAKHRPSKPAKQEATTAPVAEEIATRFLPLTYASNLDQIEGGQLVRVEMPRSTLVSFGIPMNVERANERIKADVLIGNDGVAHAIRFVR